MVLRGEMTTTTRPERPKSLHNFSLPNLKWGSQRHLKCMKIESTSSGSGSGSGSGGDHHRLRRRSPPTKFSGSSVEHRGLKSVEKGGEEEGIEELRVKLMSDLKTVRLSMTQSMFKEEEEEEREGEKERREVEVSPVKPWNLRKRRAACREPTVSSVNHNLNQTKNGGFGSVEERVVKERGEAETTNTKRSKLAVTLSKKEVEEDYMVFFGHRPPRRPKKRPRTVQKKLDSLHPAFYLTEATLDAYKVPEESKI